MGLNKTQHNLKQIWGQVKVLKLPKLKVEITDLCTIKSILCF
jgi:metal-sulfur cluster biosynthetic enzyme